MLITKNHARDVRGFTLTEAAIVLGIVGLILGAIWVAASAVYSNMRVNTANRQLMTIVQNMRTLHASTSIMDTAISTADLYKAGVFPGDTNPTSGSGGVNGWSGYITVAATSSLGGTNGDAFTVKYTHVPQAACIDMAVANSGQGRDAGLIGVNTTAFNNTTFPFNVSQATAMCTSSDDNTLVFTFKLKG